MDRAEELQNGGDGEWLRGVGVLGYTFGVGVLGFGFWGLLWFLVFWVSGFGGLGAFGFLLVWVSGFWGLGALGFKGFGFRVLGVWGFWGFGFKVSGLGFWGFRVGRVFLYAEPKHMNNISDEYGLCTGLLELTRVPV